MALTDKERLEQQNSGPSMSGLTLPKPPRVPPPIDPRQLPQWYDKFHSEMCRWVDRVNQAIVSNSG